MKLDKKNRTTFGNFSVIMDKKLPRGHLTLQSKKQEEMINRLQADLRKYKSESAMMKKQMKEKTKEYEMQLNDKNSTIEEYLKIMDMK